MRRRGQRRGDSRSSRRPRRLAIKSPGKIELRREALRHFSLGRLLPMLVNLMNRRGRRLTGRARCLSDVACGLTAICGCARRSWILARRKDVLEAKRLFSPLDQSRLSVSGTIPRARDGDAIPPSAGPSGLRRAVSSLKKKGRCCPKRHFPFVVLLKPTRKFNLL